MDRDIEKDLLRWKHKTNRTPLLLQGARQVGKSFIIDKFGRAHFENLVTVNFEQDPRLARCFDIPNANQFSVSTPQGSGNF